VIRPALLLLLATAPLHAQELEPRALINAPVGTNFVLVSTGYLFGNVLLDPALPLENGEADVWTFAASFARAINFFGLAGKIGVGVPLATGRWSAEINGIVAEWIRPRSSRDVLAALGPEGADVPCAAVQRPDELLGDPQLLAREMIERAGIRLAHFGNF